MNRLILLGNGFDLAHGLPTSYENFILNYTKKEIKQGLNTYINDEKNNLRDFLKIEISKGGDCSILMPERISSDVSKAYTLLEQAKDISDKKDLIKYLKKNYVKVVEEKEVSLIFRYQKKFSYNLITENNGKYWSDIEAYFYKKLKDCLGIKNASGDITKGKLKILKEVKTLNKEFRDVTFALGNYLTKYVEKKYNFKPQKKFIDILSGDEHTKSTLVLNFNYTQTADMYLPYLQKNNPTQLIQIHGKLDRFRDNPIIFGFGDEYDNTYKLLENFNDNSLFYHIKSFGYFKSNNYRNMESFVESDPYEIFIIGHSCGLSDRTLLKYLFEHNNCKSIKIYHYQDPEKDFFKSINNYISVTQEISRHFDKKADMRSKIVPFNESDYCPQVKLEKMG